MRAPIIALALFSSLLAAPTFAAEKCGPLRKITTMDFKHLPGGGAALELDLVDRPTTLLFDTGGATRSLKASVVKELGLRTTDSEISLTNVAGRTSNQAVTVPSITLGGVKVANVRFQVMPPAADGDDVTTGHGFDGIFTLDMFHGVDFDLDFGLNKFSIFKDDHCKGKVVYWPAPVIAAVPYDLDGTGHLRFPVTLDGSAMDAILDTGASGTTLDVGIATGRFNVDLKGPDVEQVAQLREGRPIYQRRFKSLSFEGIAVANPMMTLMPNMMGRDEAVTGTHVVRDHSGSLPPVVIGMNILSKLHVYIAAKERRLYITPASAPSAPAEAAAPSSAVGFSASNVKCGRGQLRGPVGNAIRDALQLHAQGKGSEAVARLQEGRAVESLTDYETCFLDGAQKRITP